MTPIEFFLRLSAALWLGVLVGIERQWRHRLAGIQTNALVSSGAALFVISGVLMGADSKEMRIAAQIVSGIGFLGGGVILREGFNVRGLNTAATLWCSAAVGTLSGFGFYTEATIGAASILTINFFLRPLALLINRLPLVSDVDALYRIHLECDTQYEQLVQEMLDNLCQRSKIRIVSMNNVSGGEPNMTTIDADVLFHFSRKRHPAAIFSEISSFEHVRVARWEFLTEGHE